MSLLPGRTRGVQEQPNPTQRRERSSNAAPSYPFLSGGSSSTLDVNDSNLRPNVFVNRGVANSLRVPPYNGTSSISPANSLIFNSSGEEIPPLDSSNSFQLLSSSPPNSSISLTIPRPDHQRSNNLYVDTPFPHRPTPRREESSNNSPHNSTLNVRSSSPATRTVSPSSLSANFSQNSSLNSSQTHPNTSTLPSVHGTHVQRSFINPNCRNVNNINSSTNCHNVKNSSSSNNRINKLSSSSFSFSSSKNRGGGLVIQNQSTTPLNFVKNNHFGGSGGVGGKSFTKSKHSSSKKDLSKSVGDLRADDRRVSGNFLGISNFIGGAGSGDSIICSHCGKCRCEACTTPKSPPSAWICNGKCLCSPAGVVDCLSCAFCVKGMLYHCRRGEEGSHRPRENLNRLQNTMVTLHDDDASSTATKDASSYGIGSKCALWSCLILAAVPLPCLLCYFPLTVLRKLLEKCYQRCTYHGCRCSAYAPPAPSSVITSQPSSVSTTPLATPPTRPHLLARPLDTRLLQEPSFAPPSPPSLLF